QRIPVATGQQRGFWFVAAEHRAEAMDYMAIGQLVCTGDHSFSRLDGSQCSAFFFQRRPRRPMNGTSNPTARKKSGIGSIDDSVEIPLGGNVTLQAFQSDAIEFVLRHDMILMQLVDSE